MSSYCFLLNTMKHNRYFLKCYLLFVITLKTNKTGFTIGTLYMLQAHISTKIALLRLHETLIIKIRFSFTFSANYRSVVIHKKLFTNFNVFLCLDVISCHNSNIDLVAASMLNLITKPVVF
jgi:hypothetical protein